MRQLGQRRLGRWRLCQRRLGRWWLLAWTRMLHRAASAGSFRHGSVDWRCAVRRRAARCCFLVLALSLFHLHHRGLQPLYHLEKRLIGHISILCSCPVQLIVRESALYAPLTVALSIEFAGHQPTVLACWCWCCCKCICCRACRARAWRLSEAHPLTATALVMQNEFLPPFHD